jgi:hypothetical protein
MTNGATMTPTHVLPQYLRHLADWCERHHVAPHAVMLLWADGPSLQIADEDFDRVAAIEGATLVVRPFDEARVHESVTVDEVTAFRLREVSS